MASRDPTPAWFDAKNPICPSAERWTALSDGERVAIRAALPFVVEHDFQSEGDAHARAVREVSEQLEGYFRGGRGPPKRPFYIGRSLMVHYPDEPGFAPDLFLVFDVPGHDRTSFVVLDEGRGLDFVFEVTAHGDRRKDLVKNPARFARLGIPEYFVLDLHLKRLHGFRLNAGSDTYETLVPQLGRFESRVLGLELEFDGSRVQFYVDTAPLATDQELRARLERSLDRAIIGELAATKQAETEAQRADAEAQRATAEAQRATAEAQRAAVEAERAAAEAQRADTEAALAAEAHARIAELERLVEELRGRSAN